MVYFLVRIFEIGLVDGEILIYIYIFRLFEGFVRNKLEKSFTQNGMDLSFKKKTHIIHSQNGCPSF